MSAAGPTNAIGSSTHFDAARDGDAQRVGQLIIRVSAHADAACVIAALRNDVRPFWAGKNAT
jgi:hypothetical protein